MARMERAGTAWETLSEASVFEWRRYAKGLVRKGSVSGDRYHPVAFNVFSGLFCKLQQIDAGAPVPLWPPQGSFMGDDIAVSVEAVDVEPLPPGRGRGGVHHDATLPQGGGILYLASGANAPGVLTELLYQKLPGRHRLPKAKYKSGGFRGFSEGDRESILPLEPGWYACAYAFVEASSGRTTAVVPLGTVAVGALI